MAALHIRAIPEPVAAALRERARRHGRSVQQEVLQILQEATEAPLPGEELPPLQLTTAQVGATSMWSREEMYGDQGR